MTPGKRTRSGVMTDGPAPAVGEVRQLFDVHAVTWSAKYAPDGPLAARLACLLDAVGRYVRPGDRVLDLGCGTGELARALVGTGLDVAGCDISPEMLRHAARDPSRCVGWVQLEPAWRTLPFCTAAFDLVIAASVLEYVTEPTAVLRECARVLRSGGVVLYTVPDLRHPVRWAEWLARWLAGSATDAAVPSSWLQPYRAYLRTSRQRHRVRWWLAASGLANLRPLQCPDNAGQPALRLLAFRRVDQAGARR
jgi:SAM-dependent methyltransferase